jgi:hypothetical protein
MGQKRRELVRRVGYDAKNAAHLVRLLEIKRGAWSLERVKSEAERLFQLSQEAYVRSSCRPNPIAMRLSAYV